MLRINRVYLCNYKLYVHYLGITIKVTLVRFHQKCKHHYWCNCVRVNADGTQHKWKIKMVLLGSMETLLSSGCSETMLTSEQPLRRLYLSVSLIFLCSPRIVWSLGVVTVFVGHTNGLYERVAEILSFLWICSVCVCVQATCCCWGGCCYTAW